MNSLTGRSNLHCDIVPTHPRGDFSASGVLTLFQAPKELFDGITLLEPRLRRVSLAHVSYNAWRDYLPLAEACAGSAEELHILATGTIRCHGKAKARRGDGKIIEVWEVADEHREG